MAKVCHASSKVAAKGAMELPKMQGLEKLSGGDQRVSSRLFG